MAILTAYSNLTALNAKTFIGERWLLNGQWITIDAQEPLQNVLYVAHGVGNSNATDGWYAYLIGFGYSESNTGKTYKIAGTMDMEYNWNNGRSIGIKPPTGYYMKASILYM